MTIRDLKDIPMVMRTVQIPEKDFTEEERDYYKIIGECCENHAESMGQTVKFVPDENAYRHCITQDDRSWINEIFGVLL